MDQGIECCKINWQTTNMKGMKNFNNALKFFSREVFLRPPGCDAKLEAALIVHLSKLKKG